MSKSLFDRAPIIIMLMFEGASPHISQRRIASYGSTHTHTHTRTHAHAQHTPEHFLFCSVCPQQEEEVLGSRMLEELQPLCAEGCVNVLGDCCGYSPHHVATLRDMAMAHCPRQLSDSCRYSCGCLDAATLPILRIHTPFPFPAICEWGALHCLCVLNLRSTSTDLLYGSPFHLLTPCAGV
eukprot:1143778-Pelagomonas_calceolata.AAC.2